MAEQDPEAARRAAVSRLITLGDKRPLSASVNVTVGALSRTAASHRKSEDHYLVLQLGRHQETLATSLSASDVPPFFRESAYAMLVADGVGEGGAGSVASRVALSTVAFLALDYGEWNVRVDPTMAAHIFDRAEWFYSQVDTAVHTRAASHPSLKGMSTAMTAAYSSGTELFIAHVGHTRAYMFREGELLQLTHDHTIEQHLADTRRPVAVERRAQDASHILTDAIGAPGGHPMVEIERYGLRDGDCVMLCTNGLTDRVSDAQIAEALAYRRAPQEQCATLIELANRSGDGDHTTVVLAEYHIKAM